MDGQFVLSNGDPTGYGYHGDFQMGWDSVDFLQSAVDTCTNASGQIEDCPLFNIQTEAEEQQCKIKDVDAIKGDNPLLREGGLPISVPIQSGPAYATNYPVILAGDATQAAASATSAAASSVQSAVSSIITSAASASAVVPTLSYTPGTSSVTDKYGGGVLRAKSSASYVDTEAASTVAASTVTAVASLADADTDADGNIIATSWYTSGNQVMEMMIEQVDVTVTATAVETANAHARRHVGKEHRRVRGHPRR
ncbi:hypothetical protein E4T45_04475 [Aureobasidium sp. EXF-8846]|nr:hypothetical protein E4T45_04475 [Aureobasidium sp. EXF-8846]